MRPNVGALSPQRPSMDRYHQIFARDEYRWPSGRSREAAVFTVSPDALMGRTSLAFEVGIDDQLGPTRGAGVALPSGRRVLLMWYENSPVPGLALEIDGSDDPEMARREVMSALGLRPDEVAWAPDVVPPAG